MSDSISQNLTNEIKRRKTFAIISHPDAGKTTITEKLLLFGKAIHMAGMVKAKKNKKFTRSDWMEIEKQRGISVTSSVMQFDYAGHVINLLDTPGHEDFSEDTYRVLTAVDSALMILDGAKGIETQTLKLFQVCRDRHIPILTFINKMDLPAKDPFELIDEIEQTLHLQCSVMTWPIGSGDRFRGVYDCRARGIRLCHDEDRAVFEFGTMDSTKIVRQIDQEQLVKLREDLELFEGAGSLYSKQDFLSGKLTPVFFGSALKNFGVQDLLDTFIVEAPAPLPREAREREVNPEEAPLTGVIFKIQANMDPKHRDRVAFMRICSGSFHGGDTLYHVRLGRELKNIQAMTFLSQERRHVETAYPGDIIGIHDKGNLKIGDTLTQGELLNFTGIPQFSPELFCRVELKNPIKMKQLQKGITQLAEEGASQVFKRKYNSDTIVGVVGQLQFEVVKFRLLHEYGADATLIPMPFTSSRWYACDDQKILEEFEGYYADQIVMDVHAHPMILFKTDWENNYVQEKHPGVKFFSNLIAYEQDTI